MTRNPISCRLLVLCFLLIGICSGLGVSQNRQTTNSSSGREPQKSDQVRLKMRDGSSIVVDDAWETVQGFWYRQGGMSHLVTRDRVKAIERGSPADTNIETEELEPITAPQENGVYDEAVWIHLVGGARVEADSATESAAGVWYKRGPLSIFIERSRVDHIEREQQIASTAGAKERGWSTGNQKLDGLIRNNGSRYGVDPYLIFLVMEQESHFNTRVVSPKGARGLMQLMPGTSARFGVRRPHDPAQNISGGTRYLRQLLDRFNNRVDLVLASYNAGEGAVMKYGGKVPPYRETRNYVKRISFRYKRKTSPTKTAPTKARVTSETAGTSGGR